MFRLATVNIEIMVVTAVVRLPSQDKALEALLQRKSADARHARGCDGRHDKIDKASSDDGCSSQLRSTLTPSLCALHSAMRSQRGRSIMTSTTGSDLPGDQIVEGYPRRRDFIYVATGSFAAVGVGVAAWPLVDSMNPTGDVLALSTTEVDISAVAVGMQTVAVYRGQPLFVRHLTQREIAEANSVPLASLRDPQTLTERTKPGRSEWLVTIGICTHLGCVPLGARPGENKGKFGGYFCPCHGSVYDTAARIREGPAPLNLVVPDYVFLSPAKLLVGVKK